MYVALSKVTVAVYVFSPVEEQDAGLVISLVITAFCSIVWLVSFSQTKVNFALAYSVQAQLCF